MYSLAARSTIHRVIPSNVRRVAAVTPRFYTSTMHDNDPEVLEKEKQRNLKNEQHKTSTPHDNAPGWNEHLASASEAAIKADRAEVSPQDLVSRTIKYVKSRHREVDSPTGNTEGRVDTSEASYEREEVKGPLKGKGTTI